MSKVRKLQLTFLLRYVEFYMFQSTPEQLTLNNIGSRIHLPAPSVVEWFFVRIYSCYRIFLEDLDFRPKLFSQDLATGKALYHFIDLLNLMLYSVRVHLQCHQFVVHLDISG